MSEEGVVAVEEERASAAEEPDVLSTAGAERQDDESDAGAEPLLQHSCDHAADTRPATDGPDTETSVGRELAPAGGGSVGGWCSGSGRPECPVCRELLDPSGVQLNCDHSLCRHCSASIMSRARAPGRLRCPLCRQTTPFPQWEIRRLQEESYSSGAYEPGPGPVGDPAPPVPAVPASPRCCFAWGRQLGAHSSRDAGGGCIQASSLLRGLRRTRFRAVSSAALLLLLLLLLLGPVVLLWVFFS